MPGHTNHIPVNKSKGSPLAKIFRCKNFLIYSSTTLSRINTFLFTPSSYMKRCFLKLACFFLKKKKWGNVITSVFSLLLSSASLLLLSLSLLLSSASLLLLSSCKNLDDVHDRERFAHAGSAFTPNFGLYSNMRSFNFSTGKRQFLCYV